MRDITDGKSLNANPKMSKDYSNADEETVAGYMSHLLMSELAAEK